MTSPKSPTLDRATIVKVMAQSEDDIDRAARKLGIAPRMLDRQILAVGLTEPVCFFCYRDKGDKGDDEPCTCGARCWIAFALPTRPPLPDEATLSMRRKILDAMDRVEHDFDRAAHHLRVPAHTLAQRIVASGMTDHVCQFCCLTRPPSRDRCECGARCWVLVPAMSTAHTQLTAAERKEQEALRRNWAAHNWHQDKNEANPIYRAEGDCGHNHLSLSAATACANLRRRPETQTPTSGRAAARSPAPEPTPSPTRPASPTSGSSLPRRTASPAPKSSAAALPTYLATASPAHVPRSPTGSTAARSTPTPPLAGAPGVLPHPSGSGTHSVPAAREPVPGGTSSHRPRGRSGAISPRQATILDTLRSSPTPLSANAIATAVGGRKATVLEEIRALLRDGLLVSTKDGLTLAR